MEGFNSEISGSSSSILSEPPDIRNWFSSYKYESFVLDTYEFGGLISEEMESDRVAVGAINREKLENFNGSGEVRKADEHGNLNSNEDSLHPSSILSEPPDLRNWFSSYTYESSLLDTNDGLKGCVSRESEYQKDELVAGEKIKFTHEVANLGQFQETSNTYKQDASENICSKFLVKCNGSSVERGNESQYSLFSEPPDIGNWFPDYVYESPVLDTSDELRHALSKDTESNEDRFVVEESKRGEQENYNTTRKPSHRYEVIAGRKIVSKEFGKCTSSLGNDKQENKSISKDLHCARGRENVTRQGGLSFDKMLNTSLAIKQMQGSSINLKEDIENSIGGDSLTKLETDYSGKFDFQLPIISESPSKDDSKSFKKLIDRRSIEKSSESETEFQRGKVDLASHDHSGYDQVSVSSLRHSTRGSNNKENEGKDTAENGFITTRKNKFTRKNDVNSLIGRQEILLQCSTNKGGEKDGVPKRKVLAETTNVQQCGAMEIPGKWRCPQKSKPHRGSPLKQLRLEQWFRRV